MIRTQTTGHVLELTIDRPERRNAVDHAMLEVLTVRLGEPATQDVRVVVLTGAGGHFCAGADLSGVEDDAFPRALRVLLDGLRTAPFVTIAAADVISRTTSNEAREDAPG